MLSWKLHFLTRIATNLFATRGLSEITWEMLRNDFFALKFPKNICLSYSANSLTILEIWINCWNGFIHLVRDAFYKVSTFELILLKFRTPSVVEYHFHTRKRQIFIFLFHWTLRGWVALRFQVFFSLKTFLFFFKTFLLSTLTIS